MCVVLFKNTFSFENIAENIKAELKMITQTKTPYEAPYGFLCLLVRR